MGRTVLPTDVHSVPKFINAAYHLPGTGEQGFGQMAWQLGPAGEEIVNETALFPLKETTATCIEDSGGEYWMATRKPACFAIPVPVSHQHRDSDRSE